ncbi:LOW QUALITY PROTEIN: myosin heavy chain kinase D-like [Ciona intestinalis]
MKRTKETWEDLEKRVCFKRKKNQEKQTLVPDDIMVQRMTATPSGRLKKFEPLDTRDFVPFASFQDLSIANIKLACEKYYNATSGSCDVLASDRGPSCTRLDQIKGKKVYFIRFLQAPEINECKEITSEPNTACTRPSTSHVAKSVSISTLLKAGQLKKQTFKTVSTKLETFSLTRDAWIVIGNVTLLVSNNKFASGAFRNAEAHQLQPKKLQPDKLVLKLYQDDAVSTIQVDLGLTVEDHCRKQVQMHAVAKSIAEKFSKKVPAAFGETFKYDDTYYCNYTENPATIEAFCEGSFTKYVNNDGSCSTVTQNIELQEKSECLVHFSYILSEKKLMLQDIQGVNYTLLDPEIATTDLVDEQSDLLFCAGNLSKMAILTFIDSHTCNKFCKMMNLAILEQIQE